MTSVVVFHAVSDGRWFADVIAFLRTRYALVPLEHLQELCSGGRPKANTCHITVDDGHRSFRDVMFPILKKHDVPASLFVSPKVCTTRSNYWFQEIEQYDRDDLKRLISGALNVPVQRLLRFSVESLLKLMPIAKIEVLINDYQKLTNTPRKPFQNLSREDLKDIAGSNLVTICAHTMSHPILKNEDDSRAEYEIAGSIDELSALLGQRVKYFAYPNGIPGVDFTERDEAYAASRGIQLAFSTETRHLGRSDKSMRIPRIPISDKEPLRRLGAKLSFVRGWNRLKRFNPRGEYAQRRRLSRLVAAAQADRLEGRS